MHSRYIQCKNCHKTCIRNFNFCPHCGQTIKDELTISVLFYNTISNYFSFDARFFKSFLPLIFKPGYIPKEFIKGKRMLYLHPAQYYLFVSLIFFFLFSFKTRELNHSFEDAIHKKFITKRNKKEFDSIFRENNKKEINTTETIPAIDFSKVDSLLDKEIDENKKEINEINFSLKRLDSLIATNSSEDQIFRTLGIKSDNSPIQKKVYLQLLKLYKRKASGILQSFFDIIPFAFFLMLPIFALFLKVFYWKYGRFSHHLVFSFYYFSFLFLVFNFNLTANYLYEVPDWIDVLIFLSTFFYLVFGIKKCYNQDFFKSVFKCGVILFLFSLVILPLTLTIMLTTSFFFYN